MVKKILFSTSPRGVDAVEIFARVNCGEKIKVIANEMGLTYGRVRQLAIRGRRILRDVYLRDIYQ